jgi:hypothetical protein
MVHGVTGKICFRRWLCRLATLAVCAMTFASQADDGKAQAFSPTPLTTEHFHDLKERSPFLRTLNFAETYRLRGVATIDGKPVAMLFNKETEKTIQVTSTEANNLGMKLVGVEHAKELSKVSVRLVIGGEEVDLSYDAGQIAPQGKPREKPRYDSKGRLQAPQALVNKYRTMNDAQRKQYHVWRSAYVKKYPDQEHGEKRYALGEKVVDAIKSGKGPPAVR